MLLKEQRLLNESSLSEFLLLEFSNVRELQILHFFAFLVFYLAAVAGNVLIISAVASDYHLHTPMYFFLMNLAILDVGQISVIYPKSMINALLNTRHISYSGCVAQVLLFLFFLLSDYFLLTVMAYDRYVAICNPLHYEMLMNKQACIQMVTIVWTSSILCAMLHTGGTFAPVLCSNVVDQFFCDIPQLIKHACSDLYWIEMGVLFFGCLIALGCFLFIVVTYVHIFTAVLRIPSVQGRQKAISTCLPHLIVFSILIFSGYFAYLKPTFNSASKLDLAFTLIYTMVPPLMNPLIYSMRNKEIKHALSKLLDLSNSSRNTWSSL
ncbi:olfactory receptor 14A16-like [Elgaria multicarinata webbii]|uniref:olfactory receptor 14A16-like n=1 Tax=Elgaria multicarinata webbii TaxID=159646 RepID=UPI002FCCCC7A